jgi:hypothetical protein
MNGTEYATPKKSAYPAYIAILLAVAMMIAGGITKNYEWILVAIFPLLLGLLLWRVSLYQIRFRFGPTAIEVEQPKVELPYKEIVAVRRSRWKDRARSWRLPAIAGCWNFQMSRAFRSLKSKHKCSQEPILCGRMNHRRK